MLLIFCYTVLELGFHRGKFRLLGVVYNNSQNVTKMHTVKVNMIDNITTHLLEGQVIQKSEHKFQSG